MKEQRELECDMTFLGPGSGVRFECHAFEYVEIVPPQDGGDFRVRWKPKPRPDAFPNVNLFTTEAVTYEREGDDDVIQGRREPEGK